MGSKTSGARIALAGLALALMLTAPADAAKVSFGPNLDSLPANSHADGNCAAGQPDFNMLFQVRDKTCMWAHIGSGSDSLAAPASGTVTAIRVKVGAITGPMRVNVIRFLFRQTGTNSQPFSAGPFLEAYGPQFTPTANSIFPVATNLAMTEDPTPAPTDTTTIQVIDVLALEMLSPTTPIPLFSDPGALSYEDYPGPTQAGVVAPSPGPFGMTLTIGAGVEMNADLDTGTTGGPITPITLPGTPGTPTAQIPRFGFPTNLTAPVTGNTATVPIQCLVADCTGTLALQNLKPATARAATAKAKKPKVVTYGSAKFTAKAGKTAKVKVTLNSKGRALLHGHTSAKVWVAAKFTKGNGAAKSARVTLKKH